MIKRGSIVSLCAIVFAGIGAAALTQGKTPSSQVASAAVAPPVPAALDRSAYDAKMLALANLTPRTDCAKSDAAPSAAAAPTKVSRSAVLRPAAFVSKRPMFRPCRAALWPVHAVYPEAGALLPFKRIVAYYGNFYSPRMGVLGQYPPDKVLAMLTSQVDAWAKADPSTPVVPALDYIVVAAQQIPGRDGMHRMRMPPGQIEKAVTMADQIHGLLFLDVQPGWSTVEIEVPRLAEYLKSPNVELALDPEFALTDRKQPGAWRGTMSASDINFAARFLAKIVRENHLPPKVLVVHRFTQRMVTDYRAIKPLPEVQIVMDMDGFGSPPLKLAAYRDFIEDQPVQFTGFKLFYKNDVKWGGSLMAPSQVLRLSPQPIYIVYQ